VTVADVVDQASEVFADLLCSDPEWVDAEFEQIVSGFWDEPMSTAGPPRSPSIANHAGSATTERFLDDRRSAETSATIRSPP